MAVDDVGPDDVVAAVEGLEEGEVDETAGNTMKIQEESNSHTTDVQVPTASTSSTGIVMTSQTQPHITSEPVVHHTTKVDDVANGSDLKNTTEQAEGGGDEEAVAEAGEERSRERKKKKKDKV